MIAAPRSRRPSHLTRAHRRVSALLALLVLWQALAVSFHLATERHLAIGDPAPFGGVAGACVAALPAAHEDAAPGDGAGAEDHPHAPHAAIDHQVAQDRADDDLSSMSSLWLPMTVVVVLPRDLVGVTAGAPPTGPPLPPPQRTSIAARAPPLA